MTSDGISCRSGNHENAMRIIGHGMDDVSIEWMKSQMESTFHVEGLALPRRLALESRYIVWNECRHQLPRKRLK